MAIEWIEGNIHIIDCINMGCTLSFYFHCFSDSLKLKTFIQSKNETQLLNWDVSVIQFSNPQVAG